MTRMVRQIDGLTARVEVARHDNVVVLIAFETERAKRVGLIVAQEMRASLS